LTEYVKLGQLVGAAKFDEIDFWYYKEDPMVVMVKSKDNLQRKAHFSCTQEVQQIRRMQLRLYDQTVKVKTGRVITPNKNEVESKLADPAVLQVPVHHREAVWAG
jgi:hypothetical protein